MRKLTKIEKFYVRAAIILFLLLVVKSMWIDEYRPSTQEEITVYNEYMLEVGDQNILKYKRIIKIYEMEQEKADKMEAELKYDYRIKIRVYLFGVIPYMEGSEYIYK